MSYTEQGRNITLPANADLSSSQYLFVDCNSTGRVAVVAGNGYKAVGVLQNKPAAIDRAATVQFDGVTKVKAGAAVAKGADIMSNATGQAITATTGLVSQGTALEAATAANQLISVLLKSNGTVV